MQTPGRQHRAQSEPPSADCGCSTATDPTRCRPQRSSRMRSAVCEPATARRCSDSPCRAYRATPDRTPRPTRDRRQLRPSGSAIRWGSFARSSFRRSVGRRVGLRMSAIRRAGWRTAGATVEASAAPDPARVRRFLFCESAPTAHRPATAGRVCPDGFVPPAGPRSPIRRVHASISSRPCAALSSTSSTSIRAFSSSARTSAERVACTPPPWACRRNSAVRVYSIPVCPRKASSAAPSAWPPPD